MTNISEVFRRVYNGRRNIMTPNLVTYGKRGKMVYELSSGTGLGNRPLFGVSVIELPSTPRHDLSDSFPNKADAMAYITNDFIKNE